MTDEKHGHIHHSKSTRDILSADRVLSAAGLKVGDFFLDAGCGDGFISLKASEIVGENGKVYAADVYPESVETVSKEIQKRGITNLEALVVDLTDETPFNNGEIDLCVMANVMHGFVANGEVDQVMREISRIIKPGGVFAVVEFKIEAPRGPPANIRIGPDKVIEIVSQYEFDVNRTLEVGEYHYLVKAVKKYI